LSLAALADKANYSKSSWERCLNGKTLPPRHAVAALAQLVGQPAERPLALWERAQTRWNGRAATPQTTTATAPEHATEQQDPVPSAPSHRRHLDLRGWALAAVMTCVVVVAALALLPGILGISAVPSTSSAYTVGCRGPQCAGQDPHAMACDIDTASYADLRVGQTYLELRISDQCGAAWARISHSAVGDQLQVADQDGRTESVTVVDAASAWQFIPTLMIAVDRHSQARACLKHSGERRCTPWGTSSPVPIEPTAAASGPDKALDHG
jgi:hypothetical protein